MNLEVWVLIIAALALGGFVKGATGLGLPLISIPVLAAQIGVVDALAIMVIPMLLTNAYQSWRFRNDRIGTEFVWPLIGLGIVGIAAGTWLLTTVPEGALSIALGIIILTYLAFSLLRPQWRVEPGTGRRASPFVGFFGGVLQGATGISTPITVTFIHALKLDRRAFVFAVSIMFLGLTLSQVVALAYAGILTAERAQFGLMAMAPIMLALPLGAYAAARLSRRAFEIAIMVVLFLMALRLIQTGLEF